VATCKHYAANDFESYKGVRRYDFDAQISLQDLSEYYLPPFKTCAVKDVGSFMCSYNGINGYPLCANPYLLDDILRKHWEWEADNHYVTTDCDVVPFIVKGHHFTEDYGLASAFALKAGTDLQCNGGPFDGLYQAVDKNYISQEEVDKALTRMYASLVSAGFFDPVEIQPLRQLGWDSVNLESSQELAYRAAVEGAVLIKNDGVLPLSLENKKSYALIGPWVGATIQMQGNYYGPSPYLISPLQAAKDLGIDFKYVLGAKINESDASFSDAIQASRTADVIIFMGGITNVQEGEDNDRKSLSWPSDQTALIRELKALGKPVIILQFGGGQIDDTEWLDSEAINAILWGGYPGQSGGQAILDLVFGKVAPAGRLSLTQYPASYLDDVPATDMNLRPAPGNANLGRTHQWYNGYTPVPFGHGLHYTTWNVKIGQEAKLRSSTSGNMSVVTTSSFVDRSLTWQNLLETDILELPVTVTNTGNIKSDYVVLLFMRTNAGPAPHPLKSLVAYTRAKDVQPGTSTTVNLVITLERVVRVDGNGNRVLYPGDFEFFVDLDIKDVFKFSLSGPEILIEAFPQPQKNQLFEKVEKPLSSHIEVVGWEGEGLQKPIR
jgi:xylan 1,4-beta-xylosidase